MDNYWELNAEYSVRNGNFVETDSLPNTEIFAENPSNESQILFHRNGCSPPCYPEQENYLAALSLLPSPSDSELSQDAFEPFCYSDLGPAGWEQKKSAIESLYPKVEKDYRSSVSSPSASSTSSSVTRDTSTDRLQKQTPSPDHDDRICDTSNGSLIGPDYQKRLRIMEKASARLAGSRLGAYDDCNLTKKKRHSVIEKRYRTTLNDRISSLHDMIPCLRGSKSQETKAQLDCRGSSKCQKVTKEAIISGAIEYIQYLEQHHGRVIYENEVLRASLGSFGENFGDFSGWDC